MQTINSWYTKEEPYYQLWDIQDQDLGEENELFQNLKWHSLSGWAFALSYLKIVCPWCLTYTFQKRGTAGAKVQMQECACWALCRGRRPVIKWECKQVQEAGVTLERSRGDSQLSTVARTLSLKDWGASIGFLSRELMWCAWHLMASALLGCKHWGTCVEAGMIAAI